MLDVQVKGLEDLFKKLNDFETSLDLTRILDEASALIFARIRARFLREEAPDGSKWKRSHAALWREALGIGGGTLYDTGRLYHSIQLHGVGPKERTISTDVPYAAEHDKGLYGQVPRKFLGFNEEDGFLAQQIALKRISEVFK